ncbi:unnamed protein product [Lasius platythorax]|uniref:Uncharacterized protein n=1 Tax=Lasius platythorax TaxID=488582 RepID=A0AAV2NIV9_9HYME
MRRRGREEEKKKKEADTRGKETNKGIAVQDSYPKENQGNTRDPGLFEARRRSSSQQTVCTVKVARIDRTAGLSSTISIGDYFRHCISRRALH